MAWNKETKKEDSNSNTTIEFKSLKDAKEDRGLHILSYGKPSSGKTHFGLTGKGPVYVIDTENGASPLADTFPDAKVVVLSQMKLEDTITNKYKHLEETQEILNYIKLKKVIEYLNALPEDDIGTIVIDSVTDIWAYTQAYIKNEVFKLTILQKVAQQWDWGTITSEFYRTIDKLKSTKYNIYYAARQDEIYEGAGKPTGQYKVSCQKKMEYYVDIVLYHDTKFVNGKINFITTVKKWRGKGFLIGKTFTNLTFDKLKTMTEDKNEK